MSKTPKCNCPSDTCDCRSGVFDLTHSKGPDRNYICNLCGYHNYKGKDYTKQEWDEYINDDPLQSHYLMKDDLKSPEDFKVVKISYEEFHLWKPHIKPLNRGACGKIPQDIVTDIWKAVFDRKHVDRVLSGLNDWNCLTVTAQ